MDLDVLALAPARANELDGVVGVLDRLAGFAGFEGREGAVAEQEDGEGVFFWNGGERGGV